MTAVSAADDRDDRGTRPSRDDRGNRQSHDDRGFRSGNRDDRGGRPSQDNRGFRSDDRGNRQNRDDRRTRDTGRTPANDTPPAEAPQEPTSGFARRNHYTSTTGGESHASGYRTREDSAYEDVTATGEFNSGAITEDEPTELPGPAATDHPSDEPHPATDEPTESTDDKPEQATSEDSAETPEPAADETPRAGRIRGRSR